LKGLEDPARAEELRTLIARKPLLKDWYRGIYAQWALASVPEEGLMVEIGSGAGFAKEWLPALVSTDTLPYPGVDQVVDALAMPFGDGSVRALFLLNVLHHLPDAEAFFREAQRVLKPGGLLMITDQHVGPISRLALRWAHHEPFDPGAAGWAVPVAGPLAGANGALAWMVFRRDRGRFEALFPALKLESYRPFAPLQYWLAGGLKGWSLVPGFAVKAALALDRILLRLHPGLGSFCHVTLRKENSPLEP
jgi:SAM-dependent methyltransferase